MFVTDAIYLQCHHSYLMSSQTKLEQIFALLNNKLDLERLKQLVHPFFQRTNQLLANRLWLDINWISID